MTDRPNAGCPECSGAEDLSRRAFVRKVTGAVVATGLLPAVPSPFARAADGAKPSGTAETSVKRFYESLSDTQKKQVCFPFDHPLRNKINANWAITKPTIDEFFNKEQQAILDEIFRGVVSPDGYERFKKQMDDDAGGFEQYHVAVFGTPGSGEFEWELTGRHVTLRADGDSVAGAAFGGPIDLRPRCRRLAEGPPRQRLLLPDAEGQRGLHGPRRHPAQVGACSPRPRPRAR